MREKCKPRPNALVATAYHEAGHAVIAFHLGIGLKKRAISINEDEESLGRVGTRLALGERPDIAASDRAACELRNTPLFPWRALKRKKSFVQGVFAKFTALRTTVTRWTL
jgi:hypothetical protein